MVTSPEAKHYVIEAPNGARLSGWRHARERAGEPQVLVFTDHRDQDLRFPDRCSARYVRAHLMLWPAKILRVSERTPNTCAER